MAEDENLERLAVQLLIDIDRRTQRIERLLYRTLTKENVIMANLAALTTEVQNTTTVEESAVALINGLAAQIAAAGTDPVALQALQDQLATERDALAAAVTANTPATPAAG